ncbi:MAG: proline--tRNA ligase [candidate division KSB1 bacterium]|nr:proline--tRNA ligase [candidate division KSB1 bacterium]MDZ7319101.1 proline--tRNA ligase [candidate division KSB1 bacterium]MDZ7340314.1 proline--tRNA ligase [candidate division KSB1 bacterium]
MAKGITKRAEDYSRWYTDVIAAGEFADYAPVKGCMVIRPNGYALWEKIQATLDKMFKETGHQNAYFPLFIPESFMKKEAEHVEGFAPECAVVTHGGGKKLEEPLMVRPTSETIIWSMYKNWIQSYRDLPILINQWANVVRWEMRTRLFLRTTEFLWQEGHTAHATAEQAEEETLKILNIYTRFAEDYMAIPVIQGYKTDKEKFAGAVRTYAIEAMMQDRRALQAGTSHNLGQNFAKAFDVTFQDEDGQLKYVYATSWGVSTRLIGAVIMAHGDDQGLIIPPRLATTQLVIIPITKGETERNQILEFIEKITIAWNGRFSFKVDDREGYRPGWKFNEWEQRGVPLRIEIGPKDFEKNQVILVRRDTSEKTAVPVDQLTYSIEKTLDAIQHDLFKRALKFRDDYTFVTDDYADFKVKIEEPGGFFWIHWCGNRRCEDQLQEETKATIRCIPLKNPFKENGKCLLCGEPSAQRVIAAKAY